MNNGIFLTLASLQAVRPVFMIVMGVFMMVVTWRISARTESWTARLIIAGALLLCFGYAVIIPLYEAGKIESMSPTGRYHGDPSTAMAWHAVKLVVMNSGWLLFGLGLARHARILPSISLVRKPAISRSTSHESAALRYFGKRSAL